MKQIVCGGRPEEHFERLGIKATKTYDGRHPYGEGRWTVWELDDPNLGRLILDSRAPDAEERWTRSRSWWRECGGSVLGGPNGETTINGHLLLCWDRRDRLEEYDDDGKLRWDPLTEGFAHVFEYLCDHVGASSERNVAACLTDLAAMNGLSVGELLERTVPEAAEAS